MSVREQFSPTLGGGAVERRGANRHDQHVTPKDPSPDVVTEIECSKPEKEEAPEQSLNPDPVQPRFVPRAGSHSFVHSTLASSFNPLSSTLCRDLLLSYAQRDYFTLAKPGPSRFAPVPIFPSNPTHLMSRIDNIQALLSTLTTYHPTHIPTLLLLSSIHYTSGDLKSSLEVNQEILRLEPRYVEAMCNIGCIMHCLREPEAAYAWWWKALQLQPTYWDAMDNLLDLISSDDNRDQNIKQAEALAVCDFIRRSLLDEGGCPRLQSIPQEQLHKLQGVTYTRASILHITGNFDCQTPNNYSDVVSLSLLTPRIPRDEQLTIPDLIVATCITGLFFMDMVPPKIIAMLGLKDGAGGYDPDFDILQTVHRAGYELTMALHDIGFDSLPAVFLDPDQVSQLPLLLFRRFNNVLPCNCSLDPSNGIVLLPETIRCTTDQNTSQALLMIAKYFQDSLGGASVADGTFQSCRISASLVMILYYLALALSPSAIGYNNLGALMSMILPTTRQAKKQRTANSDNLTTIFYQRGLQLVPNHAHLLTNLGSAVREKGDIFHAMSLYSKAIEIDPHLESALVNLASALRDAGRTWDSVPFYKRVLESNASPDALCGLAGALSAICDWRGRGWLEKELKMVQNLNIKPLDGGAMTGWIHDLVTTCGAQVQSAYAQNAGFVRRLFSFHDWLNIVQAVYHDQPLSQQQRRRWEKCIGLFFTEFDRVAQGINEGGFGIRLVEWLMRGLQRQWYITWHGPVLQSKDSITRQMPEWRGKYERPCIPSVGHFPVPSLQPFHTFSFPLESRTIRLISHRNALRVSYRTLTQPWLPEHVYPPPPPPVQRRINIGYVSYDFLNHPLAHLIQSVFGFHDSTKFNVHTYATSADDGSPYRQKIAKESHAFVDVSSWTLEATINRIVEDQIHILINLGGFTRGSNNEIFAARPCPVQILMMGFPGSCGAGWCDYLLGDVIACPPSMRGEPVSNEAETILDIASEANPEVSDHWMFTEKMIYMPHTFMVTDHRQSYGRDPRPTFEEEEQEKYLKRRAIFPDLPQGTFIFANFNQLYKIDPVIFSVWMSVLSRVPQSILWLLRFPSAGEEHLKRTAQAWAGEDVMNRIRFTDVVAKEEHIRRAQVADLFLDTAECSAHTVATDVLWSGTPILTWPKHIHKMCSRVAASIANATGFGDQMVVQSIEEYEQRAVTLALETQAIEVSTDGRESELRKLRRGLYRDRYNMPLFDTRLWTKHFEKACWEAWERWVSGVDFRDPPMGCKRFISFTESGEIEK